ARRDALRIAAAGSIRTRPTIAGARTGRRRFLGGRARALFGGFHPVIAGAASSQRKRKRHREQGGKPRVAPDGQGLPSTHSPQFVQKCPAGQLSSTKHSAVQTLESRSQTRGSISHGGEHSG